MYDNYPNEGMRCIKQLSNQFLSNENIEGSYDVFNVRANEEVPDLGYDIFISSGGPGSPLPSGANWEKKYFRFIDSLIEHNEKHQKKKHLFLICHSFQMVSNYLEVGEINKRKSTSFGVMPIHKTEAGKKEDFFDRLPEPFYAVDSRDYQLIKPNRERLKKMGALLLCLEKLRPYVPLERAVMAIRFTNEIFGTQFHPEADSVGMLHYYLKEEKKELVIKHHGEEKYYEIISRLDDPDKIMLTESIIIPNFLKKAAENLLGVSLNAKT